MESITKNRQTPATLRRMVERAYGADQVLEDDGFAEEISHGWFNATYLVRLRDGQQVVLKIAPPPHVEVMTYEIDIMATEVAALELISAHTAVPVPALHHYDSTHELVDADYFFMEYIDGENLSLVNDTLTPEVRASLAEQLGRITAELNTIPVDRYGWPLRRSATDSSWRETFARMVDEVLCDGEKRQVDLGWDYTFVRQTVADRLHLLDVVTEPKFVAWDLWIGNVLVRDDRVVGVIDHERPFFGDPIMENVFIGAVTPTQAPSDAMRGYGKPQLTTDEANRRALYDLHLFLIMVIETAYRAHGDEQAYRWAREQLDQTMAVLGRVR